MNKQTISKLLELNKEFYVRAGSAFSQTRNYGWPGWKLLLEKLKKDELSINNVLDLACGNGRFLSTLRKYYPEAEYTGIDDSEILLHEAELNYHDKNAKWINQDALSDLQGLGTRYDLITIFGFLHHIPSFDLRNSFLLSVSSLLNNNGRIVISIWDFIGKKYHLRSEQVDLLKELDIDPQQLEQGDHILDWRSQQRALRYAHAYEEFELQELLDVSGLKLESEYLADGRDGKSNRYLIIVPKGY